MTDSLVTLADDYPSQTGENKPLGVAIVGTGFGQKIHIPGFQAYPGTEVVVVYHRDIDKASAIADAYQIPNACDEITELVKMPEVQAVSISTPPFLHNEMAKIVLESGKHLLLEKPTALSAQESRSLYHLAADSGAIATMDFEFRFVPAWQRFKELLDEGYCGEKRLIKIDWLASSRAAADRPWNWYSQKDKGGGALGAIGSHAFDYIRWLFGPVKRLSGHLSTSITERPDPADGGKLKLVDADDSCLLMLELTDGTPVNVCLSSTTYQGRGHFVEVYGDRGTLILGSSNQKDYVHGFTIQGAPAGEDLRDLEIPVRLQFPQTYSDGRLAPFIRVVDNWVQGINRGQTVVPSLKEGVYSQLLMDLTLESHATGTWVTVPNFEQFLANS
jgi:predicted dehydrogenase